MTGSYNVTSWILPVPKTVAVQMSDGVAIMDHGLPASVIGPNEHPLLIQAGTCCMKMRNGFD